MDTQNTNRQLRYLEEVRNPLHRAGFETLPLEGEQLPVLWNGAPLCRITGKGSVFYRRKDADTPHAEDALYRVEDIAAKTLEYPVKDSKYTLANANVDINGVFAIRGVKVIRSEKGPFGVFAYYIVLRGHKAGGEIIGADLGRGDHIPGDELAGVNVLRHTDDLRLLADALIEQRRDAEADHQRQQNADDADDRAVFENTHGASPPLF